MPNTMDAAFESFWSSLNESNIANGLNKDDVRAIFCTGYSAATYAIFESGTNFFTTVASLKQQCDKYNG